MCPLFGNQHILNLRGMAPCYEKFHISQKKCAIILRFLAIKVKVLVVGKVFMYSKWFFVQNSPCLYKRCIWLYTRYITIWWTLRLVLSTLIHWTTIYLIDSVIHLTNNWSQVISGLNNQRKSQNLTLFLATKFVYNRVTTIWWLQESVLDWDDP